MTTSLRSSRVLFFLGGLEDAQNTIDITYIHPGSVLPRDKLCLLHKTLDLAAIKRDLCELTKLVFADVYWLCRLGEKVLPNHSATVGIEIWIVKMDVDARLKCLVDLRGPVCCQEEYSIEVF
jgi:hypothetical protein